jgi:hypothetical protein
MRWVHDKSSRKTIAPRLFNGVTKGPDLLIYLRSSIPNLVSQIHSVSVNMKTH